MGNWAQRPDGRWVPAEPLPEAFGVVWERFWIFRRDRGEWWLPSLIRSWIDARAVTRPVPVEGEGSR